MHNSVINGTVFLIIIFISAQFQATRSDASGDMGSGMPITNSTEIYEGYSGSPSISIKPCFCNVTFSSNESCVVSLTKFKQNDICSNWTVQIEIQTRKVGSNLTEIEEQLETTNEKNCTVNTDAIFVTVIVNTSISLIQSIPDHELEYSGSSSDDLFRFPTLDRCVIQCDEHNKNSIFNLREELLPTLQDAIDCAFNRSKRAIPIWINRYKPKITVERLQPAHSKEYMLLFILNFGLVLILMKAIICFRDLVERRMTRKTKPPSRSSSNDNLSAFV
ncbi:uncharacterized protein LOC120341537 [Styela clava]